MLYVLIFSVDNSSVWRKDDGFVQFLTARR